MEKDGLIYMWCTDTQDQFDLKQFAKKFQAVKDFPFTWTRWGNWEKYPPVIAVTDAKIVGFHAMTFSQRTLYINSYYQAVLPIMQGRGIAATMVDFYLREFGGKYARLKLKTPIDSPGEMFWKGFGLQPFGKKGHEYLWDEDIMGVKSLKDLILWMDMRKQHQKMSKKVAERHIENGVEFL